MGHESLAFLAGKRVAGACIVTLVRSFGCVWWCITSCLRSLLFVLGRDSSAKTRASAVQRRRRGRTIRSTRSCVCLALLLLLCCSSHSFLHGSFRSRSLTLLGWIHNHPPSQSAFFSGIDSHNHFPHQCFFPGFFGIVVGFPLTESQQVIKLRLSDIGMQSVLHCRVGANFHPPGSQHGDDCVVDAEHVQIQDVSSESVTVVNAEPASSL